MKNIRNKNGKGELHGYQVTYWGNGNIWFRVNMTNGEEDGYEDGYWSNGEMDSLTFYII